MERDSETTSTTLLFRPEGLGEWVCTGEASGREAAAGGTGDAEELKDQVFE